MKDKGLANAVLRGSRNLNQMKKDIRETCEVIHGLLVNAPFDSPYIEKSFGSDRCVWRITLERTRGLKNTLNISCNIKQTDGTLIHGLRYRSSGECIIYIRQTQPVYSELDVLMNGVSEAFDKEVGWILKLMLEASKQTI